MSLVFGQYNETKTTNVNYAKLKKRKQIKQMMFLTIKKLTKAQNKLKLLI